MCNYCREVGGNAIATELFSRRFSIGALGTAFATINLIMDNGVPSMSVAIGPIAGEGKEGKPKGIVMNRPIHYCPMCGRALNPSPLVYDRPTHYKDRNPELYSAIKKEYLKGKTMQQIADKLHISRDRVKYRIKVMKRRGEIQVDREEE